MPQSGRQLIGAALGTQVTRDNSTFYVRNTDGDKWIVLENRLSEALCVACVDPQSSQATPIGMSVPALSLASVPIDPDKDVLVSIGRVSNQWQIFGRQGGVNMVASQGLYPVPRTVVWSTWQEGSMFSRELYPLDQCMIVSRGASLGAGAQTTHGVDAANSIIDLFTAKQVAPFQNTPNPLECAMMGASYSILSLGAGVDSSQLVVNIGSPQTQDFVIYGASAAAANVPAIPPYIIPLPGCSFVGIGNNGAANISFVATYWVGIPPETMY